MAEMLADYQLVKELGDYLVYERLSRGTARTGPAPRVEPGTRDVVGVQEAGVHLRLADPGLLWPCATLPRTLLVLARRERSSGHCERCVGRLSPPPPAAWRPAVARATGGADLGRRLLAGVPASPAEHVGFRADLGGGARAGSAGRTLRRGADHRHALSAVLSASRHRSSALPFAAVTAACGARSCGRRSRAVSFAWAALRYGRGLPRRAAERELPQRRDPGPVVAAADGGRCASGSVLGARRPSHPSVLRSSLRFHPGVHWPEGPPWPSSRPWSCPSWPLRGGRQWASALTCCRISDRCPSRRGVAAAGARPLAAAGGTTARRAGLRSPDSRPIRDPAALSHSPHPVAGVRAWPA